MIYICVPAHDEGQTVGVVLWKIRQVMAEADRDYQILVADDGSTDKTPAVLEPYTRVLPLTVLRTEQRRGYGASLEMLLREAVHRSEYPRRDAVVVLQADFTEDPEHIVALLKRIESGADVVVGNPLGSTKAPLKYRLTTYVERLLARRVGVPVQAREPLSGYHAYRVSALRRAFEQDTRERLLPWKGRAANAALLAAVVPHARRVDVVEWTPRPERRQRRSRSELRAQLREVWDFARNRLPADVIPVAGLAPSTVRTARTADHEVSVDALRAAGVTRAGDEERPRRRRTAGSRNGKARGGVKEERRSRRTGAEPAGGAAEPSAEAGTRKRRRRKTRPERAGAEAGAAEAAATIPEAESEATEPVRRRSRRGGRRTRKEGETEATTPDAQPVEVSGEAEVPEVASEGSEEAEPRQRRRRGRRGGRRRSGRSRDGAEAAPEAESSGDAPPGPEASEEGDR